MALRRTHSSMKVIDELTLSSIVFIRTSWSTVKKSEATAASMNEGTFNEFGRFKCVSNSNPLQCQCVPSTKSPGRSFGCKLQTDLVLRRGNWKVAKTARLVLSAILTEKMINDDLLQYSDALIRAHSSAWVIRNKPLIRPHTTGSWGILKTNLTLRLGSSISYQSWEHFIAIEKSNLDFCIFGGSHAYEKEIKYLGSERYL